MSISTTWSRVVAAVALAAGATCFSMTSASAMAGDCVSFPSAGTVIDSSTHTSPATNIAYSTSTANGSFYGSYGTDYQDFDLGYHRTGGSGSISVYFAYWEFDSTDGTCSQYKSGTYTIATGQLQNYKFSNLEAYAAQNYGGDVGMYVSGQGWVLIEFNA